MIKKEFGFWDSPITASFAASGTKRYSQLKVHRGKLYWLEQRPSEKGRSVVMCQEGEKIKEVTPASVNVHTKVHEYGGGDYAVGDSGIYYVDGKDQCIYRLFDDQVKPVTLPPAVEGSVRYADLCLSPDEKYLIGVREQHTDKAVINDLVIIELQNKTESFSINVLSSGADFYLFPCFSPNGKKIAWVEWNLPQMPWDGTTLWCADFDEGKIQSCEKVAGSENESIYQPSFSPDNQLVYVSDKSGFWNLYQSGENIAPMSSDCGYPAWIFGTNTYAFIDKNKMAVIVTNKARQQIGIIENKQFTSLNTPYDSIEPSIAVMDNQIIFIGGNAKSALAIHRVFTTGEAAFLSDEKPSPFSAYLSAPESIEFKTTPDEVAYAFYYAPNNPDFIAPDNTKPPLLVMSHGGPTASTTTALDYKKIQFWTSRGFAVMDVNYRGSTGYGREYRNLLYGRWGEADVVDCISAAQHCIDRGLCDPRRIFIHGRSASGLTTLLCLENSELFAAGAVYYGVTDLKTLLDDTHKFESRYTINLVGPYPQAKAVYEARSALRQIDKLNTPLIVFQGEKDKVVPPSQSEAIVNALKKKHVTVEYVVFGDEGHGFRNAENISVALEKELAFYCSSSAYRSK